MSKSAFYSLFCSIYESFVISVTLVYYVILISQIISTQLPFVFLLLK